MKNLNLSMDEVKQLLKSAEVVKQAKAYNIRMILKYQSNPQETA